MKDQYDISRRIRRQAMEELLAHARQRYGEIFFQVARQCYPGLAELQDGRFEALFLPWALYRWKPQQSALAGIDSRKGAALPASILAEEYLQEMGEGSKIMRAHVLSCIRTIFRFLKAGRKDSGIFIMEDMLDQRKLRIPAAELPQGTQKGDILFAHTATVEGMTLPTHPPLRMEGCKSDEARDDFEKLQAMVSAQWRNPPAGDRDELHTIVEHLLFMHARHCLDGETD